MLGESVTETISLTLPTVSTGQSFADIVFVIDESGSMGGEQAWIRNMVLDLDVALEAEGIGANRYGLVGYGGSDSRLRGHSYSVGGELLGTAAEFVDAANSLVTTGGTEDGYDGLNFGLNYPFREGAAVNFILVTDEDRDVVDSSLNFSSILNGFNTQEALLNAVVDSSFRNSSNQTALGVDFEGNAYIADGAGNFIASPNGVYLSGSGTTKEDYVDLAWAVEGAAWDLNQLRLGGLTATSFTQAFIEIKAQEIQAQLPIDVISSDPSVGLVNLTGELRGLGGGETATFDIEITGDGTARSFDLLFVRPGTNIVLGSIPVTVNNDYLYPVKAIDADGDVLIYSLPQAPAGATINKATGRITWDPTETGEFSFTVQADDGRGGIATQDYQVTVSSNELNQDPTITSAAPTEAAVNRPYSYTVTASDPDGDALAYYLNEAPAGLAIDRATGEITWTPTEVQIGSNPVEVLVLDGRGGQTAQSFEIAVNPDVANQRPEFNSTPVTTTTLAEPYQYQATAIDANGDILSYDLPVKPEGMTVDAATGIIVWQPTLEQVGTHDVILRVKDGQGGVDLQSFQVGVEAENIAPLITSNPPEQAVAGLLYQYRVRAQDAEGDTLTFSLNNPPAGVTIDQNTGVLNFLPATTQIGSQDISITVSDDRGGETTQTYTL